jgi:hypothetical protein
MSNKAENFDAFLSEISVSDYQYRRFLETPTTREKQFASWLEQMSSKVQCDMENMSPSQREQLVEALIKKNFGATTGVTVDEQFRETIIELATCLRKRHPGR